MFNIKTISSLEKVFWDSQKDFYCIDGAKMLKNQLFSYQVAFKDDDKNYDRAYADVIIESDIKEFITVKSVGNVPSAFPAYENHDNYIKTEPGFYPDVLKPVEDGVFYVNGRWNSLWVLINSKDISCGIHKIQITLVKGENTATSEFVIEVVEQELQQHDITVAQWLHCDCICNYHNVEMFSDKFWLILKEYIKMAADYGVNTILTPLFTPPLDTIVGGERLTCQLVDVTKSGSIYSFDFSKLDKWVGVSQELGIKNFEFSHLFTQWGAKWSPKIEVTENHEKTKLFGWHTKSNGDEYVNFLNQFLPSLKEYIYSKNLQNNCYLHISDEPSEDDIEFYRQASDLVHNAMPEIPIMDAISSYDLYKKSKISHPVVAIDHIQKFLDAKTNNLFAYYCCVQNLKVTNRFFAMPSYRNRVFGLQCYIYEFVGFLQWGYNFYNNRFSIAPIDPYAVTDAECGFPSGDAFSVYPLGDGCTQSLRLVVFKDALQDYSTLKKLEAQTSREYVLEFIKSLGEDITLEKYPDNIGYYDNFYNKLIEEVIKTK